MAKAIFPCGCSFDLVEGDRDIEIIDPRQPLPRLKMNIYELPIDCPVAWDMVSTGKTVGIFQLEGHLGITWSKLVKPDNLNEQGALVSLIRPGCIKVKSGDPPKSMTKRYVDRKHGEEPIEFFGVQELQSPLGETYGVLVYQEQAMKIAVEIAGFNPQEADILRKAIGKKKADIMSKLQSQFVEGCVRKGIVSKEKAEEIFGWIRESQRYSFNKSHAITYGKNSYWSAYAKAHFPIHFYRAWLTGSAWKQDTYKEVERLVADAKDMGIEVRLPDFRHLREDFYIKDNEIYFGLVNIRQIGAASMKKLRTEVKKWEERLFLKIAQWSWLDYLIYFSSHVSSDTTKALIYSGALDYLGEERSKMIFEYEKWCKLTGKEQEWISNHQYYGDDGLVRWEHLADAIGDCKKPKSEGGGVQRKTRIPTVASLEKQLRNPPHSLEDNPEMIVWSEERYLGTAITHDLVATCPGAIRKNADCSDLTNSNLPHAAIAVKIQRTKEHKTKRGENAGAMMAFLTVQDGTAILDNVLAFPGSWKVYKDLLQENNTVVMEVERLRGGGFSVRKVFQI